MALAEAVGAAAPGWVVRGATLAGDGTLDASLEDLPKAQVYPMFMADGWFTKTNLRKRLRGHAGEQMPPFGVDPSLPRLVRAHLGEVLDARAWTERQTPLVLLGHGSGRSPYPALDMAIFADRLGWRGPLRCGFVEQDPRLSDALAGQPAQSICLPFFAARRGHMLDDVPEALAETDFAGLVMDPIGLLPDVPRFIARALNQFRSTGG